MANVNKNTAVAPVKRDIVDAVSDRIKVLYANGEINFPPNYSPANALKSAWLQIQNITNGEKKPVLEVCTKESIANCLLDMVVQGLNPIKKQCYFIPYGNQLTLQRSYFGTMHVTKMVRPDIEDIVADVVYKDDIFVYSKIRGRTVITKHEQQLGNIDNSKIICAYATVIYKNGTEESLIMTMTQLKQAWKQARKNNPIDDKGNLNQGSTHAKFTEAMSKKTVINRLCKRILNTTDDSNLILQAFRNSDEERTEKIVHEEVASNANKVPLNVDMETGEVIDADYREVDQQADAVDPLDADIDPNEIEAELASAAAMSGAMF